jgi:hypothetical protein
VKNKAVKCASVTSEGTFHDEIKIGIFKNATRLRLIEATKSDTRFVITPLSVFVEWTFDEGGVETPCFKPLGASTGFFESDIASLA